jgi:MOSC domain-containing protein YiiM
VTGRPTVRGVDKPVDLPERIPVMARVISVNVGRVKDAPWAEIGRTGMDKQPVSHVVRAHRLGLEGDHVGDVKHHGGVDQAVYAFAREDLDWWAHELGSELRDGQFAENLTTEGIDVNEAEVGERWRIGTALFEVCSVRIPCNDFKNWQLLNGYDATAWVKRFTLVGRPGPYLRVVEEGQLRAGDELTVEHRPGHGVTVTTMFRALTTEHDLLPELLRVEDLVEEARQKAEKYVGRTGVGA